MSRSDAAWLIAFTLAVIGFFAGHQAESASFFAAALVIAGLGGPTPKAS